MPLDCISKFKSNVQNIFDANLFQNRLFIFNQYQEVYVLYNYNLIFHSVEEPRVVFTWSFTAYFMLMVQCKTE